MSFSTCDLVIIVLTTNSIDSVFNMNVVLSSNASEYGLVFVKEEGSGTVSSKGIFPKTPVTFLELLCNDEQIFLFTLEGLFSL